MRDTADASGRRPAPAGDVDYEPRADGYARQRRPDPRIAARVHAALGTARVVVNVGAGAGSYEPADRHVVAIEPSAAMRAQRPRGLVPAIDATAERLPLDDGAVDAAMATVTIHQWPDVDRGLREMRRVARSPIVILTFDGDAWTACGWPGTSRRWPRPSALACRRSTACAPSWGDEHRRGRAVPFNCTDGFTEAFYGRPEQFRPGGPARAVGMGPRRPDDRAARGRPPAAGPRLRLLGRALRRAAHAAGVHRRPASDRRAPLAAQPIQTALRAAWLLERVDGLVATEAGLREPADRASDKAIEAEVNTAWERQNPCKSGTHNPSTEPCEASRTRC